MQQQQQQQQPQKWQCAIFGFGRAGRIHFGNLRTITNVTIKYIVDEEDKNATDVKSFNSEIQLLKPDSEDTVFTDPEVAFCVICSPTFTHEAIIRKCISSGKHIFCEKPIAKSVTAMRELYALAHSNQIILHCSFNRRYDPSFNLLKRRIPEVVGQPHTVATRSRDSPFPLMDYLRISGGFYHDCGVHDIDTVCWLLGDWPVTVFATGSTNDPRLREIDDHDTAVIVMKFQTGIIANIEISRFSTFGYDQRVEVHGPKGNLASNNICDRAVTASTAEGVSNERIQYSFPQRYAEAYAESMRAFISAIGGNEKDRDLLVSAVESLNVSMLATAAEESAKTGQVVQFRPQTSL